MGEWHETPLARSILEDMRAKAQKRLGMKRWRERQAVWDARRARRQEIARELAAAERRRAPKQEAVPTAPAAVRRCTCGGGSAPE